MRRPGDDVDFDSLLLEKADATRFLANLLNKSSVSFQLLKARFSNAAIKPFGKSINGRPNV